MRKVDLFVAVVVARTFSYATPEPWWLDVVALLGMAWLAIIWGDRSKVKEP